MRLPKQSKIRWKRGDYIRLGKAVAEFNRTKSELETEENQLYLPEDISYNEVKSAIFSRKELNRVIKSLRQFGEKNVELVEEGGTYITKWQQSQNKAMQRTALKNLKNELQELNIPEFGGYSRVQMGSIEARQIERTKESIENYEQKTGEEYQRALLRIKSIGTDDYTLRKANTYRENVLNGLEDLKNRIPEFEVVYDYFSKIQNPITFFNTMQQSQAMQDFFDWYKGNERYASFKTHAEIAEYIINEYKIEREITEKKEIGQKYKYSLVTRRGIIVSQSDSKQSLKNIVLNSNDAEISNSYIIEN